MADLIDPEVQQHFTGAKLPLKPMHIWGMRVREAYITTAAFEAPL